MELILNNLRKTYGTVQALKGISYTFKPGIYGILGANGAGKSTMINLITDNVSRDKKNGGSILYKECDGFEKQGESVQGTDILKLGKSFRAIVGYMPQQQGFYEDFSTRAFLCSCTCSGNAIIPTPPIVFCFLHQTPELTLAVLLR